MDFVSESLANAINTIVSNSLNPNRAVSNLVRSTSDIGGDIAYEQNSEGFGTWYKHAMGDAISMATTDGGVRAQLRLDASSGATAIHLYSRNLSSSLPTAGSANIVSRNSAGTLVSDTFAWTGRTDGTQLTGVSGLAIDVKKGDRIFLFDAAYTSVYTHYIELGKRLPEGLTIEVGRDVAFFTYTGCKVNQVTENFNAQEILTGTFSIVGRAEASGGDLNVAMSIGDTSAILKSGSFIKQDGTTMTGFRQLDSTGGPLGTLTYYLQIEGENDITYTHYNVSTGVIFGIPASGAGSVTKAHAIGVPVVPQSTAALSALVPPTTEPLTSFQAGMYVDSTFQEVLSATYTLNNNLFTDKFQLGDKYRAQLPEQRREVTGSLTVEFDDLVLYRKFVNSTDVEVEIRIVDDGSAGQIGTTGVYRQKHYIFPRIKFTGNTPNIGGPDVITVDMPFQALYDTTDDEPEMILILVNSLSGDTAAT
jgi:hypothetical protein